MVRLLRPSTDSVPGVSAARWTAGSGTEARVEAGGAGGDTSMNDALSRNETATPPSGSSDAGRRYAHAPPPRRHSAPSAGSLVPVPDAPWVTDVRAC